MVTESGVHRLKARILVVDCEPPSADALRDILVTKGFDVETAENGMQAIDLLRSVQHFDLLITEMKLPEMDGLELLRMIRQLKRDLPVMILTGHGTVENGIHSIEEGACDYVLKPFSVEKLMFAVNRGVLKSRPDLEGVSNNF